MRTASLYVAVDDNSQVEWSETEKQAVEDATALAEANDGELVVGVYKLIGYIETEKRKVVVKYVKAKA